MSQALGPLRGEGGEGWINQSRKHDKRGLCRIKFEKRG